MNQEMKTLKSTLQRKIMILEFTESIYNKFDDIKIEIDEDYDIKITYKLLAIKITSNNVSISDINEDDLIYQFESHEISNEEYMSTLKEIFEKVETGEIRDTRQEVVDKIIHNNTLASGAVPVLFDFYMTEKNDDNVLISIIEEYYPSLVCPIHKDFHVSSWCLQRKLENC